MLNYEEHRRFNELAAKVESGQVPSHEEAVFLCSLVTQEMQRNEHLRRTVKALEPHCRGEDGKVHIS